MCLVAQIGPRIGVSDKGRHDIDEVQSQIIPWRSGAVNELNREWGGARWPSGLEHWLGMATGHSRPGSNPTSVKTFRCGTLAIPFTPLCQCLSDETLKAVVPFYLVSMPGEVKDPTSPHGNV